MARAPKTFRARFELPAGTEMYVDPVDETADVGDDEPMTDDALAALVDQQINDAKSYESSDLIRLREKALKYFEGEVDIPAAAGRSSVVSRDVADQHGLIMPSLMRVFLATDNIAIYNPVQQSDEQFARQATDYVNYVVMRECGGYIQFRSAFHNGLLMGNGPIKHWWDDAPQYSTESFTGLSDDAYTMLVMDEDVEVIEHDEYEDPSGVPSQPPMGAMVGMMGAQMGAPGMPDMMLGMPKLHDCKLKRMTSNGRLRVMALAPEDLLLGRGVTSLDEDTVRFAAHRWVKTRSALKQEGYDPEEVDELPAYTSVKLDTPEALARDRHHLYEGDTPPDKSTDLIEGYECYVQCDYDGDGVAEWRKVVVVGEGDSRTLLANEEWGDDLPFSDIVPDPVPHRWRGRSLFDSMEDIQRIKSVLLRQTLDNIYLCNNPLQKMLENGVVNPEAAQDREIGVTVILKQMDAIQWDAVPFVADKSLGAMEYMDGVAEKRTGISRQTLALDPSVLQDQTATAVNATQSAISTKVEEYARNIAEHGGMQRVFAKILKLIVKHQDRARTVRLRGKWVEVDPKSWNANMDVTINTGLGSGSRERDLNMLMGVAAKQEQVIMQLGPANPVLGLDKLFDTYRLMVEAAGLKPADRFFPEIPPETMQQMAEQASKRVDPKVQAAQVQAQTDAQKMQMQAQIDQAAQQAKMTLEQQQMALQQEQERQQALFHEQVELAKAQRDAELQQMQLERQAQVEERQAQADIAVKERDAQWKAQLSRMEFEQEQRMEMMKFEFEKKLKLLDLWVKSRAEKNKDAAEGGQQPTTPSDTDIEFEDMLTGEGADLPEQSSQGPLQQIAASQVQFEQAMTGFGQQMAAALTGLSQQLAQGQAERTQELSTVLAEISKPKRQRVIRDEHNRVIGSETH